MTIKCLSKKNLTFAGVAAPLAAFATLVANPAEAAFIGIGPGLFSFDGTAAIVVELNDPLAGPSAGFTTMVDFGNNGMGNPDTQSIDLAKLNELAPNGTGAFASFLAEGGTVTIQDLTYTVPAFAPGSPPPSVSAIVPEFLNLNPSTGVGGVPGDDTFDLETVSLPSFNAVPGFGTILAIGGGGVFNSSQNPPSSQPGVGLFTLQFPGLTPVQVQQLFATGGTIVQTYSASFQKDDVVAVPESSNMLGLLALGGIFSVGIAKGKRVQLTK